MNGENYRFYLKAANFRPRIQSGIWLLCLTITVVYSFLGCLIDHMKYSDATIPPTIMKTNPNSMYWVTRASYRTGQTPAGKISTFVWIMLATRLVKRSVKMVNIEAQVIYRAPIMNVWTAVRFLPTAYAAIR